MIPEPGEARFGETRPFKVLSPGTQISHYTIIEQIGAGGMGVVYRAEDTKLKRHVALKFLPPGLTQDGQAKERFTQEARAASALDHPNICTVHEIGEAEDGQVFIAMACYEGETVKRKIQKGPLQVDEAIDIAAQIAEGLAEAHERGIVHRDIKPANVIVTPKGQVKVMDFGLAKLAGQARMTRTGTTVGTVAYMSPEQARGDEVDQRSDIWSLGVVLYEMLTGSLPFKGQYEQAIIYSILNEEPEAATSVKDGLPSEVDLILERALAKQPEDRYQSVDEMLADLKQLRYDTSEAGTYPPGISAGTRSRLQLRHGAGKQNVKARWALYVAVAAVGVVTATLLVQRLKTPRLLPPRHRQLTFSGEAFIPSISPDGEFIAYVSSGAGGRQSVFVQDLAGGEPLEVFNYPTVDGLRWSPDNNQLLIRAWDDSTTGVHIVPRLGGAAREFSDRPGVTWSPDGTAFAGVWYAQKRIHFTNAVTGDTSSIGLKGPFTWFSYVDWSPTGDMLACLEFHGRLARILTVTSDGSRQNTVVEDSVHITSPRWSSGGDAIYYLRHHHQTADLMKVEIERRTGRAKGGPTIVQTGLRAGNIFDLSGDNTRMLYTRQQFHSNLWTVKVGGQDDGAQIETKQLTSGTSTISDPAISPDGTTIAFNMGNSPNTDVFVIPIDGGPMKQLTFSESGDGEVEWSPDGKEIAFAARQRGETRVWRVSSSGGTPRVFANTESSYGLAWAPGADIIYQQLGNRNFRILDLDTEEERLLVPEDSPGWMFRAHYSPDCEMVAVFWNREPNPGLWVISLADSSQTFLAPDLEPCGWSSDGDWVYAAESNEEGDITGAVMVPPGGGEPKPFIRLPLDRVSDARITPDGHYVVCNVYDFNSDVWLMENFDPEAH